MVAVAHDQTWLAGKVQTCDERLVVCRSSPAGADIRRPKARFPPRAGRASATEVGFAENVASGATDEHEELAAAFGSDPDPGRDLHRPCSRDFDADGARLVVASRRAACCWSCASPSRPRRWHGYLWPNAWTRWQRRNHCLGVTLAGVAYPVRDAGDRCEEHDPRTAAPRRRSSPAPGASGSWRAAIVAGAGSWFLSANACTGYAAGGIRPSRLAMTLSTMRLGR